MLPVGIMQWLGDLPVDSTIVDIGLLHLLAFHAILYDRTDEGICNSPLDILGLQVALELLEYGHCGLSSASLHSYLSSGSAKS